MMRNNEQILLIPVCKKSLDPLYIVSYTIRLVKTLWTYSIYPLKQEENFYFLQYFKVLQAYNDILYTKNNWCYRKI